MEYESTILKRLIDTYGVVGNPRYISEIIKEFIVRGKELYPQLFTYQSDWLAHIDEFGLTPDYVVSYTGQQIYAPHTKERPVKSAILKGQTLVNTWNKHETHNKFNFILHDDGFMELKPNVLYLDHIQKSTSCLKPNTKYLLIVEVKDNTLPTEIFLNPDNRTYFYNNKTVTLYPPKTNGVTKTLLTTISDFSTTREDLRWGIYIHTSQNIVDESERGTVKIRQMLIEYQDGMENWDIPYFDGMQSVKMPVLTTTGKNLFSLQEDELVGYQYDTTTNSFTCFPDGRKWTDVPYVKLTGNQNYTISYDVIKASSNSRIEFNITNGSIPTKTLNKIGVQSTTVNIGQDVEFRIKFLDGDAVVRNIQVEVGSTATTYEPYKSNILSTPSDLELRGIGDVKDELDLITGELTERIREVLLDGSENIKIWVNYGFFISGNTTSGPTTISVNNKYLSYDNASILSTADSNGIAVNNNNLYIKTNEFTSITEFTDYLQSNPITIQYQLATESIKTVDLNILDQNGQNVKQLMSFSGGTHINTGSLEGSLLPTISVDVVTDLEETLKVCSLEGNTM